MLSFVNDYSQGAHQKVLQALILSNEEILSGYGSDKYSNMAREKIATLCGCSTEDIYFLSGGTQTNKIIISSMLLSYEGVISADSGHISVHEAGAIENSGHKVLEIPHMQGKVEALHLREYLRDFYADANHAHMVFPAMLYISLPTEYGTLYSKQELVELRKVCDEYKIHLFIDGARLGYALASKECDVTLSDIAKLCDVFYIGGTKVGALCGEAVVFTKNNTPKNFPTIIKQNGALLAKSRLLGVQFNALFTDGLYESISKNAIECADILKSAFKDKGYRFYIQSPTNQIFIIIENSKMRELQERVKFSFWQKFDENHTVIRFVTSWSTSREDVKRLIDIL